MNIAILTYDLKNVKDGDNVAVKNALIQRYRNTYTHLDAQNQLSVFQEWVRLKFPDTTIVIGNPTDPAANIVSQTLEVIRSVGADPGVVFVAYIGENSLWNAGSERPALTGQ